MTTLKYRFTKLYSLLGKIGRIRYWFRIRPVRIRNAGFTTLERRSTTARSRTYISSAVLVTLNGGMEAKLKETKLKLENSGEIRHTLVLWNQIISAIFRVQAWETKIK